MSSLKFGTSGLRGLVVDLVGQPSRDWTTAFLRHLAESGVAPASREVLVGRDLRSSSPTIARDCLEAAAASGWRAIDCGALPTPALALDALRRGAAAVMVTGSHIPDDRNGLKFYRPDGEITKEDEDGIRAAFEAGTSAVGAAPGGAIEMEEGAVERYVARYVDFFGPKALAGLRVGVYQQSSVARDVLTDGLSRLGAAVTPLARADSFIPVDTEAHRPEDVELLAGWGAEGRFDAIVSTDGDADRPLVADETGRVVRGDLVGLLTARQLGASVVVTPVTSSSSMERAPFLDVVRRTRVGSPFVISGMEEALAETTGVVVGFEANGGVLLGSDVEIGDRRLAAMPTRDAFLPIVCVLAQSKTAGQSLSQVVVGLDAGSAAADRLQEVSSERSRAFLARLVETPGAADALFAEKGGVAAINTFDGVRITAGDGSIVHYRPSGNAPELRCYVEAADDAAAARLLKWGLTIASAEISREV